MSLIHRWDLETVIFKQQPSDSDHRSFVKQRLRQVGGRTGWEKECAEVGSRVQGRERDRRGMSRGDGLAGEGQGSATARFWDRVAGSADQLPWQWAGGHSDSGSP